MKRIIACLTQKNYLLRLESFCQEEKISLTIIDMPEEMNEDPYIVIITDNKDYIDRFARNQKICLISNDRPLNSSLFNIKENFTNTHLRMLIDNIYHGALITNYSPSLMPYVFQKQYTISNDFYNIDRIVYAMTAEFVVFFKFFELEKIRVGISEMLTNSMEHGNLGITSDEKFKATEEGTYYDLLSKRLQDPEVANKKTNVIIQYKSDTLTITIKDEGKGFDTTKLPDPTDAEHLLKLHGRGIFITKMYFNEIKYNDKGNEVTLVKVLPPLSN